MFKLPLGFISPLDPCIVARSISHDFRKLDLFAASWIRTVVFSTGVTLGPVKFWFSKMNFISFEMLFQTLFFSNYLIQLLRTVEKEANDRLDSRLWREGHCAFNNSPLSRLTKTLFEPWIVHFNSSETQKIGLVYVTK